MENKPLMRMMNFEEASKWVDELEHNILTAKLNTTIVFDFVSPTKNNRMEIEDILKEMVIELERPDIIIKVREVSLN